MDGKKMPFFDVDGLKEWFLRMRRPLPWRESPSPYAVWISEIMLQQTQASVVIPYFKKWMQQFPSILAVAEAPLDLLLKSWEGLGYYSRVRHIHQAARFLVENHGGKLPSDLEMLAKIKGVGPYTQGAILSFAFHKKAAAVDGNVLRVLARYFLIEEELGSARKKIQGLTEKLLPAEEPWVVMEALIELGALVCQKKPICQECPLKESCLAHLHKKTERIPLKAKRPASTHLFRSVGIVVCENKLLVGRVRGRKVMADLYEFPYVEVASVRDAPKVLQTLIQEDLKIRSRFSFSLSPIQHTFTRYHATLFPSVWRAEKEVFVQDYEWKTQEELKSLPFSSGHRQILTGFRNADFTH
ncbi:MAG: A/G-specific adenine glycosylase [Chlamydiales bacterium]